MRGVIPLEKFIPYDKLSKKKRREFNAAKRGSWNGISPVTRKASNAEGEGSESAAEAGKSEGI